MEYYAQVDLEKKQLVQFVAFTEETHFMAHTDAHAGFEYIQTPFFGSPLTHEYIDGKIVEKEKSQGAVR